MPPATIPPTTGATLPPFSRPAVPVGVEPVVPPLCWGAIIAGAVTALSAHLLITLFGVGLGVQVVDPLTDPEPGQNFSIGVGIAWAVSALLALWIGGWVAGRLTPEPSRGLGRLHGMLVWSVATVTMALVLAGGAGMLAGGIARITGKTLSVAGEAAGGAAQGAGDFVSRVVEENSDLLGSFASELAPAQAGPNGQADSPAGAQRRVSWALVRFFSLDEAERGDQARDALVRTVADNSELSEADARRRVDEWVRAYDEAKADLARMAEQAESKAREAAEAASDYVTHAAVWTFIAFLIGMIAAACGGSSGAKCRREHDAGAPATTA